MTPEEAAAFNAGIEAAAKVAEPVYRKRKPGQWSSLRIRLADEIRACKVKNGNA
jgi:hypothetical protein